MKRFSLLLGLFVILLLPATAGAKEIGIENILVPTTQIIDDNFVRVGQDVEVNGEIHGDLVVAGSTVVVNGPVSGDILAAAETVRINGPVSGNIRVAARDVVLDSSVGKNATIFASTIEFTQNAQVGWSVQTFGTSIDLSGTVIGNVNFYGSSATVRGDIKGNARFVLGEEGTLHLASTAVIEKDLDYHTNRVVVADQGANVVGTIRMVKPAPTDSEFRSFAASFVSLWRLVSIFGLLVVGLVLLSIIPTSSAKVIEYMRQQPWRSMGWGVMLVIIPPIVAFILLLTIIGIPLALLGFLLWAVMLYIVRIYFGLFIGTLIFRYLRKGKPVPQLWALIVGVVIFSLLTWVPFVGWLFSCIGGVWALGAIGIEKRKNIMQSERA